MEPLTDTVAVSTPFLTGVIYGSVLNFFPVNSAFFNKNKFINIYVAILIKSQFYL